MKRIGALLRQSFSGNRIIALGLIAALLIGFMVVPGCSSTKNSTGTRVGNLAPDFDLVDLDGNNVRLSDLRGKVVFLNFWASWCPSCIAEMPDIEAVHQKYKDQNVVVVGVDIRENENTVRRFTEDNGYDWTFVLDKTGLVSYTYEIDGIPASFFLDTNGIIRSAKVGAMSQTAMESSLASARSWK